MGSLCEHEVNCNDDELADLRIVKGRPKTEVGPEGGDRGLEGRNEGGRGDLERKKEEERERRRKKRGKRKRKKRKRKGEQKRKRERSNSIKRKNTTAKEDNAKLLGIDRHGVFQGRTGRGSFNLEEDDKGVDGLTMNKEIHSDDEREYDIGRQEFCRDEESELIEDSEHSQDILSDGSSEDAKYFQRRLRSKEEHKEGQKYPSDTGGDIENADFDLHPQLREDYLQDIQDGLDQKLLSGVKILSLQELGQKFFTSLHQESMAKNAELEFHQNGILTVKQKDLPGEPMKLDIIKI